MIPELSINTKAILLLTAPLLVGGGGRSDHLTPREYKRLAQYLHSIRKQPADLVCSDSADLIQSCAIYFEPGRIESLLSREFLLGQVAEKWRSLGIWVFSRADAQYPRRLKETMKTDAPPILYGCGDFNLLNSGGLAVVGSRKISDEVLEYSASIGRLAAASQVMLISGGAKGVDLAAMNGADDAGGLVCEVIAERLDSAVLNRKNRIPLMEGRLVLVSAYDPSSKFSIGHAMQRNKLIYALSDFSLVVNCDFGKGGTWAGAIEQLEKLHYVPVFVRSVGPPCEGLSMLLKNGAISWPNPSSVIDFKKLLYEELIGIKSLPKRARLDSLGVDFNKSNTVSGSTFELFIEKEDFVGDVGYKGVRLSSVLDEKKEDAAGKNSTGLVVANRSASEVLFVVVKDLILNVLLEPMKDSEVASILNVSTSQARAWLQQLVEQGVLLRKTHPTMYFVK